IWPRGRRPAAPRDCASLLRPTPYALISAPIAPGRAGGIPAPGGGAVGRPGEWIGLAKSAEPAHRGHASLQRGIAAIDAALSIGAAPAPGIGRGRGQRTPMSAIATRTIIRMIASMDPGCAQPRLSLHRGYGCSFQSSLPGLTRQSINLRKKLLAKKMDARVKPAHDNHGAVPPSAPQFVAAMLASFASLMIAATSSR